MSVPVIRQLAISNVSWTAVVAPAECDFFSIRNDAGDTLIRTNQTDPTTQDSIPQGQQWQLALQAPNGTGSVRYHVGEVVAYLQSVSGSPTVIVTWL